jgi:hypothetical protein
MRRRRRPCCAICGSAKDVEDHHVGGRNHAPRFTQPLCRRDHATLHTMIARAGVDLRFTPNNRRRWKQAMRATLCFLWRLTEDLEE